MPVGGTQAVENRSPRRIGDGAKDVHGWLSGHGSHEPAILISDYLYVKPDAGSRVASSIPEEL